jgi:hypothetical protein
LALEGYISELLISLSLFQLSERLIVGVLKRARIDLVREISLVNNVTFFEMDTHNITVDPGGNVYEIYGSRSTGNPHSS